MLTQEEKYAKDLIAAVHSIQKEPFMLSFKGFCDTYGIAPANPTWGTHVPKLIAQYAMPTDLTERLAEELRRSILQHGVKLDSLTELTPDQFEQIIKPLKTSMKQYLEDQVRQKALEDLDQLMMRGKPILLAIDGLGTGAIGFRKEIWDTMSQTTGTQYAEISKDGRFNRDLIGRNIHIYAKVAMLQDYGKPYSEMEFKDKALGNIRHMTGLNDHKTAYAIETDDLIVVENSDDVYVKAMAAAYEEKLQELRISTRGLTFEEQKMQIMSALTYPDYERQIATDAIRNPYMSDLEKYDYLTRFIEHQQEQNPNYGLYYIEGHHKSMHLQGAYDQHITRFLPGAIIGASESSPLLEMGANIDAPPLGYQVWDNVKIGDTNILITSKGIIADQDISVELGLNQAIEQAIQQDR